MMHYITFAKIKALMFGFVIAFRAVCWLVTDLMIWQRRQSRSSPALSLVNHWRWRKPGKALTAEGGTLLSAANLKIFNSTFAASSGTATP